MGVFAENGGACSEKKKESGLQWAELGPKNTEIYKGLRAVLPLSSVLLHGSLSSVLPHGSLNACAPSLLQTQHPSFVAPSLSHESRVSPHLAMQHKTESSTAGESRQNKVVFTEMEEFVWGLHIDEEARKLEGEDVFMHDDQDEAGGWIQVEQPNSQDMEVIVPDESIHEVPLGKGLSGALKLLKDRGTLKESKLVGILEDEGKQVHNKKEIHIQRTDEFGRIEMKSTDTPSLSVERMWEAQALMKTPYLVLSVEKDFPGGLTPMLGDRKVEHFLGIKRKAEKLEGQISQKRRTGRLDT